MAVNSDSGRASFDNQSQPNDTCHMRQNDALIGRAPEAAKLRSAVERFLAGSPQLVLLEGDAGLGKSRLLSYGRTLVAEISPGDVDWLTGAAPGPDPGRCPDFIIWSDTMDQWARQRIVSPKGAWDRLTENIGGELIEELAVWLLAGLAGFFASTFVARVPGWLGFVSAISVAVAVRMGIRGVTKRRRLAARNEQASHALRPDEQIATSNVNRITLHLSSHFERPASKPVIFALEDLHWADESSISLLASILRAAKPGWKLLIIMTYRGGASLLPSAAFAAFERRLTESPYAAFGMTRIKLPPLDSAAGADLARTLLGTEDAQLAHWIAERSGGVPLFIRQFAGLLQEQGIVDPSGALVHPGGLRGLEADVASGDIPQPDAITAVLDRRLAGLTDDQRRVLGFLGLDGNPAHEDFLIRAVGEHGGLAPDLNAIRRVVSDCIARHGLLRDLGARGPLGRLFGFEHAFVRDAANRLLIDPERSAVEETRLHWLAEVTRRPVFRLLPLGDRARIVDRLVDAVPLSTADVPGDLSLVDLYLDAAHLQLEVGSVAGARKLLEALVEAQAQGQVRSSSLQKARVLLSSGQVAIKGGDLPLAMQQLREGIEHSLADHGDDVTLVRGWLRFELIKALRRHGKSEAPAALDEAAAAIRELKTSAPDKAVFDYLRARIHQEQGLVLHQVERFQEAEEAFGQALKAQRRFQAIEPGSAATILHAWVLISAIKTFRKLGKLDSDLGMSAEALRLAHTVCTDADDRGQQELLAYANAYHAYSLRKMDPERAESYQRQARQIRERFALDQDDLEVQRDLAVDLSIHGEILSELGRLDEALAVRQKSLQIRTELADRAPGGQNLGLLAMEYGYLSKLLERMGQNEQALQAARAALKAELSREDYGKEPERVKKAKSRIKFLEDRTGSV